MHKSLLEILACPVCHGPLEFDGESGADRVHAGNLGCTGCGLSFGIEDGVPMLAAADMDQSGAFWNSIEGIDVELTELISFHFRKFAEGRQSIGSDEFVQAGKEADGPILDIATGPGGSRCIPMIMTGQNDMLLIMSDLGKPVIRAWNRQLKEAGWEDRCSLVVCDARRLPFRDQSIALVTSEGGLSNVVNGDGLAYAEVSRVLRHGGKLCDTIFLMKEGGPSQLHMRNTGWSVTTWAEYESLMDQLDLSILNSRVVSAGRGKKHPGDMIPLTEDETWEDRTAVSVRG